MLMHIQASSLSGGYYNVKNLPIEYVQKVWSWSLQSFADTYQNHGDQKTVKNDFMTLFFNHDFPDHF